MLMERGGETEQQQEKGATYPPRDAPSHQGCWLDGLSSPSISLVGLHFDDFAFDGKAWIARKDRWSEEY